MLRIISLSFMRFLVVILLQCLMHKFYKLFCTISAKNFCFVKDCSHLEFLIVSGVWGYLGFMPVNPLPPHTLPPKIFALGLLNLVYEYIWGMSPVSSNFGFGLQQIGQCKIWVFGYLLAHFSSTEGQMASRIMA